MSDTPHNLMTEFPEHAARMQELRANDAHFAKMYHAYEIVNDAVHHAETNLTPTSDDHMTDLRKQRMTLKDRIYGYLTVPENR